MKRFYPWLMAGFISILGIIQAIYILQNVAAPANYIEQFVFVLNIVLIAFIGALIVVRQGSHRVGWLLMAVAFVSALPIFYDPAYLMSFYPSRPSALTPGIWVLLWLQGWFWLLQIIPIFQIALRFPDGRPPSARWNWINTVTLGTIILAALTAMFPDQISPINNAWEVDNPLGFMSQGVRDGVSLIWTLGLLALAAGSLASLIHRFRMGNEVTRKQIKWLLFAGAVLITIVVAGLAYFSTYNDSPVWLNIIVQIAFITWPLAIAVAIFRYRLYDIEIIIRRTLQYTVLTGLLVLMYFGGIITLQGIFVPLTGESNSSLVTVITTLGIAALFNPLRRRVQEFIDRRFFRKKYDSEIALNRFAVLSRDEVDIERLSGVLLFLVDEAMQPDHTNLWLRQEQR